MSDINVKLKNNLDDADKLFRILFASIKIGAPASKRKIADVADLSSQLVDYHIDKLVANGQMLLVNSQYMAQAAFSDKRIYNCKTESLGDYLRFNDRFVAGAVLTLEQKTIHFYASLKELSTPPDFKSKVA